MKITRSNILKFSIVLGMFIIITNNTYASEGIIELESQTNEPTKCFAASLRMQNLEYRILFSCRYLIYPVDETIFNYVVWATPQSGANPVRLGVLGLGKGEFKTKTPFSSLFVTTESKKDVKTPTGRVVLRGSVEAIEFLGSEVTPTPIPDSEDLDISEDAEQPQEDQRELTTREKLVLALKRAGIAALFALVALIGIIFVVSRSRG